MIDTIILPIKGALMKQNRSILTPPIFFVKIILSGFKNV